MNKKHLKNNEFFQSFKGRIETINKNGFMDLFLKVS